MARRSFETAARAGHVDAMFFLGNQLRENGDIDGGLEWLLRAVAGGHVEAAGEAASILDDRGEYLRALELFETAAAAGDSDAQLSIALLKGKLGDRGAQRDLLTDASDGILARIEPAP